MANDFFFLSEKLYLTAEEGLGVQIIKSSLVLKVVKNT